MSEIERDEQCLIEYVLGHCDAPEAEAIRGRLASDEAFAARHEAVANALAALGALPEPEAPEDLIERTLGRVRAARRTEVLLASQPAGAAGDGVRSLPLFSFRELGALAAAAVLAVAILLPSLVAAHRQAQRTLCADNVRAIHTAMSHYAGVNDGLLPAGDGPTGPWLVRSGSPHASNSAGLFRLIRDRCAMPDVFQCPATDAGSFVVTAGMLDFPSPRSIGYSYQHSLGGPLRQDDARLTGVAERMAILADATPLFDEGRFVRNRLQRQASDNHRNTGQNVLYLAGNVAWTDRATVGVNDNNIWLAEGVFDYVGEEEPASVTDTFLLPHPGQ